MSWLDLIAIPLLARICLIIVFPFSTLDKIFDYKNAVAQANSSFLPDGRLLLVMAGIVEIGGSACILFTWHDRLAAFVLAAYCIITALLFHQFWAFGDFWSQGKSKGRDHFWDFLKNFGLAGGLLMIVTLGNLLPVSTIITHPFSSTHLSAQESSQ